MAGASSSNFGVGEIDQLTGGTGSDVFVLGSSLGACYTGDTGDYAFIKDFTPGSDRLVLHGTQAQYHLGSSGVAGVSGAGLFYDSGDTAVLIAILHQGNDTALTEANTIHSARFS